MELHTTHVYNIIANYTISGSKVLVLRQLKHPPALSALYGHHGLESWNSGFDPLLAR